MPPHPARPGQPTIGPVANGPNLGPAVHLAGKLAAVRERHGVPALAAVLVRDGGSTVVARAGGVRKWDASHTSTANAVRQDDVFNIGSVTKPFTGYLIAHLVQQRADFAWTTTIGDVFPELASPAFRARYRVRQEYLGRTVEQLMSHNAGLPYAPANGYEMVANWPALTGAFQQEYATAASLDARRYNYLLTSLQDAPEPAPGPAIVYGGGSIICAAMAERLTGQRYEDLMAQLVFGPLGMTRSGFGRLARNAVPDGVWEHVSDPSTGAITPSADAILPQIDFHSHGPAGAAFTTAADLGRFIAANLSESGRPKAVVSDATLRQAHAKPDAAESNYTRGGWERRGSGTAWYVGHNGDNCRSRAEVRVLPGQNVGYGAMANVSNGCRAGAHIGADAVDEMLDVLEDMHANWAALS